MSRPGDVFTDILPFACLAVKQSRQIFLAPIWLGATGVLAGRQGRPCYGESHAGQLTVCARRHGMRNLREDGWEKVAAGVTTAEEVMRVTQEF